MNILNRIITWENGFGIKYEADQRHGEILVESMGLQDAKPVSTPGIKESEGEGTFTHNCTEFRAVAARGNYLSQDRPDLQLASK